MEDIAKKIWDLIEDWGPDVLSAIQDIANTLAPTEYLTFCGKCGAECPVHVVTVNGKKIFRGKCPEHGFKRDV